VIFGDGSETIDLVFVKDVAEANLLAARSLVSDEVFNVASGTEISLRDLACALAKVMGSVLKPELSDKRRTNPVSRRLGDTSAAHEKLGFVATTTLEEGLTHLVDWWRRH
jgi:UDP-glucose 4-epimerase